jgi:hypothetical protein
MSEQNADDATQGRETESTSPPTTPAQRAPGGFGIRLKTSLSLRRRRRKQVSDEGQHEK